MHIEIGIYRQRQRYAYRQRTRHPNRDVQRGRLRQTGTYRMAEVMSETGIYAKTDKQEDTLRT